MKEEAIFLMRVWRSFLSVDRGVLLFVTAHGA